MLDISDLRDYIIDGCEFDIYDINVGMNIAEGLDDSELSDWCDNHDYELCTFEPTTRMNKSGDTVFGITFNVENVEER